MNNEYDFCERSSPKSASSSSTRSFANIPNSECNLALIFPRREDAGPQTALARFGISMLIFSMMEVSVTIYYWYFVLEMQWSQKGDDKKKYD